MEKTEKDIERYLCRRVKEVGGKAYKFVSPGNIGVPDRLVIVPTGTKPVTAIYKFIEIKKPGGKLRPQQEAKVRELMKLGAQCWIVDSYERVDWVIKEIETTNITNPALAVEVP